jgi:hypothetical protein
MTDPTPGNAKAIGAVLAGAFATILVYVLDQFLTTPLPADIVAAVQTVLTVGVVYFTPHSVGGGS